MAQYLQKGYDPTYFWGPGRPFCFTTLGATPKPAPLASWGVVGAFMINVGT